MKTLYIHIGTPKTATTTIQKFCEDNHEILESKGYCYPIFPYRYKYKHHRRNGSFLAAVYRVDGIRNKEEEKRRYDEGMAHIHALFTSFDHIILSDEGIWWDVYRQKPQLWQALKADADEHGYTIRVIVYLRRQDEYIMSFYNQRVKHFVSLKHVKNFTFDRFLEEYEKYTYLDYCEGIDLIAKALGSEAVIVRRFADAVKNVSIQKDFFDILGLELTDDFVYDEESEWMNLRINENHAEIKRIINENEDFSDEESRFFEMALIEASRQAGNEHKFSMFSRDEAIAFMEQFDEGNQKIARTYIGDGQPLFSETFADVEKWDRDNPYFMDDLIRFISVSETELYRAINEANQRNVDLEEELKEVRASVKKLEQKLAQQQREMLKLSGNDKQMSGDIKRMSYNIKHPIRWFLKKVREKMKRCGS